jgi:hypothetical protein
MRRAGGERLSGGGGTVGQRRRERVAAGPEEGGVTLRERVADRLGHRAHA